MFVLLPSMFRRTWGSETIGAGATCQRRNDVFSRP